MKKFRLFVLLLLLAIAAPFALHYRAWARVPWQAGQGAAAQTALPSALRIVSPQPNEKLSQTFVTVKYQQIAPASAAATPTYELRLDGQDPVHTPETTYTFNGLTPGTHDLIVQQVDANGTPISGTLTEVKFVVVGASSAPKTGGPGAALIQPPLPPPPSTDLPASNSSLPLLSVIGFGILVGGVISALRTRPAHK
jgi:hypothetical protein